MTEKEAEAQRGQMADPSWYLWVAELALLSRSPDSKLKAFLLYPFLIHTKWKEPDTKDHLLVFLLVWFHSCLISINRKTTETKYRQVVAWSWGQELGSGKQARGRFLEGKNVLKLDCDNCCMTILLLFSHEVMSDSWQLHGL